MLPERAHEWRVYLILTAAACGDASGGQQIVAVVADKCATRAESTCNSFFCIPPPWFVMPHAMNGRRAGLVSQRA